MINVMIFTSMAVVVSLIYGTIVYWDVMRLVNDEVLKKKVQKRAGLAWIRAGGVMVGHGLVIFAYGFALQANSIGGLITAAVVLFFPTALVLSTPVIRHLDKGAIFLSAGVNAAIMIFLKVLGVI